MKRAVVLVVILTALVAFSGCGKKNRESAVSEALEKAATTGESTGQENFLVYEGDTTSAAPTGEVPATTTVEPTTAAVTEPATMATEVSGKPTNEQIQQALAGAGLYDGPVDGKIGPKTKRAIRKFQITNGLTVDGKVGKKTWMKMQSFLSSASAAPAASAPETTTTSAENAY